MNAGMTAIQSTARMLSAIVSMKSMASRGPMNAPTVSSDWRRPKQAPRRWAGAISPTRASRGAPRIPLPIRSMKRAASTSPIESASGKSGLVTAARP